MHIDPKGSHNKKRPTRLRLHFMEGALVTALVSSCASCIQISQPWSQSIITNVTLSNSSCCCARQPKANSKNC